MTQRPNARRWLLAAFVIIIVAGLIGCAALSLARVMLSAPTPAGQSGAETRPVMPTATVSAAGRQAQPTAVEKHPTATPDKWSAATSEPRSTATPERRPTATALARATATRTPAGLLIATPLPSDRMATIRLDQLPPQAHETIQLLGRGGPFPYRQDGAVFENRERLLPRKSSGYYHEYTVKTPGSPDRGARRLVRGNQGELYYTDDHYDSFRRVKP